MDMRATAAGWPGWAVIETSMTLSPLTTAASGTFGKGTISRESRESTSSTMSSRRPLSTILPASSRLTESQTWRTTLISWVMMMTVRPRVSRTFLMRSRMERVVSGSRAEVGSSHSRTAGSSASARAMPTRCFWPPESWEG